MIIMYNVCNIQSTGHPNLIISSKYLNHINIISAREMLAVCDVTNLPYMDVN